MIPTCMCKISSVHLSSKKDLPNGSAVAGWHNPHSDCAVLVDPHTSNLPTTTPFYGYHWYNSKHHGCHASTSSGGTRGTTFVYTGTPRTGECLDSFTVVSCWANDSASGAMILVRSVGYMYALFRTTISFTSLQNTCCLEICQGRRREDETHTTAESRVVVGKPPRGGLVVPTRAFLEAYWHLPYHTPLPSFLCFQLSPTCSFVSSMYTISGIIPYTHTHRSTTRLSSVRPTRTVPARFPDNKPCNSLCDRNFPWKP